MPCVCGLEGVLVEGFLTVYHISSFLVVCCVEYQTLVGLCKSQLLSVPEWKQLESKHEKGIANVREEPLLPGLELATFRSRVQRPNQRAIPVPGYCLTPLRSLKVVDSASSPCDEMKIWDPVCYRPAQVEDPMVTGNEFVEMKLCRNSTNV